VCAALSEDLLLHKPVSDNEIDELSPGAIAVASHKAILGIEIDPKAPFDWQDAPPGNDMLFRLRDKYSKDQAYSLDVSFQRDGVQDNGTLSAGKGSGL
jgi:hypothetical protein